MIPISQDEIHHFSDRTSLVQGSVNIVNWNWFGELPSMKLVALSIVMVNNSLVDPLSMKELTDFTSPVSVVSSSTFSLRGVEPSSAEAMMNLDGSCPSHFGCLFQAISIRTTIGFSDTGFFTSIDGSTVSLTEHIGKTEKKM